MRLAAVARPSAHSHQAPGCSDLGSWRESTVMSGAGPSTPYDDQPGARRRSTATTSSAATNGQGEPPEGGSPFWRGPGRLHVGRGAGAVRGGATSSPLDGVALALAVVDGVVAVEVRLALLVVEDRAEVGAAWAEAAGPILYVGTGGAGGRVGLAPGDFEPSPNRQPSKPPTITCRLAAPVEL